jgi:hypothetical protein
MRARAPLEAEGRLELAHAHVHLRHRAIVDVRVDRDEVDRHVEEKAVIDVPEHRALDGRACAPEEHSGRGSLPAPWMPRVTQVEVREARHPQDGLSIGRPHPESASLGDARRAGHRAREHF